MTEAEWLECSEEPGMMMGVVERLPTSQAAKERKARLFATACCRDVWPYLIDERTRRAVEMAERLADGLATMDEAQFAALSAVEAYEDLAAQREAIAKSRGQFSSERIRAGDLWYRAQAGFLAVRDRDIVHWAVYAAKHAGGDNEETNERVVSQCHFLRDIFGNPFRPVTLALTWLTSTVTALARQMYESRDFSAMPILADAIQDAGCDSPDILTHCRGPGPHVRGCWVVDGCLWRGG